MLGAYINLLVLAVRLFKPHIHIFRCFGDSATLQLTWGGGKNTYLTSRRDHTHCGTDIFGQIESI